MGEERYQLLDIQTGKYRLIPEAELDAFWEPTAQNLRIQVPAVEALTFGFLLYVFRTCRRMTFENLATKTGIGIRTLKDLKNKNKRPHKDTLNQLCKFFGPDFEQQLPSELWPLFEMKRAK